MCSLFLKSEVVPSPAGSGAAATATATSSNKSGKPLACAWRRGIDKRALLAARYESGEVRIYDERGQEEATKALQKVRGGGARCMAWHPTSPILAVGWNNGSVTVWKHAEGRTETSPEVSEGAVECIEWAAQGRLAVGSESGTASVWKVRAHGTDRDGE